MALITAKSLQLQIFFIFFFYLVNGNNVHPKMMRRFHFLCVQKRLAICKYENFKILSSKKFSILAPQILLSQRIMSCTLPLLLSCLRSLFKTHIAHRTSHVVSNWLDTIFYCAELTSSGTLKIVAPRLLICKKSHLQRERY